MKVKTFLIFIILSAAVYGGSLLYLSYEKESLKEELMAFDLNNDGSFSKKERTEDQQQAMVRVTNDTARNLARYTLIPISLFIGLLITFLFRKLIYKSN